jgi:hypothetical protein
LNFLRFKRVDVGPNKYLDFKSCFFFISKPLLCLNRTTLPSPFNKGFFTRIITARQMSPFLLNLNLKPLYSIRGGSTTLAEPLIKNPNFV